MKKKILYIDMDGVLVDFQSGIDLLPKNIQIEYLGREDEAPGIFGLMKPYPYAIESFQKLSKCYDTYILSTAPWDNSSAWSDKLNWVKTYLEKDAHKRLILSHNKNLNEGDYLVDDSPDRNGADKFKGELIHFQSKDFPDWKSVCSYLIK